MHRRKIITSEEREIIDLLVTYPAIKTANTYTIHNRRVEERTLERMKERGLVEIGIHPANAMQRGYIIKAE